MEVRFGFLVKNYSFRIKNHRNRSYLDPFRANFPPGKLEPVVSQDFPRGAVRLHGFIPFGGARSRILPRISQEVPRGSQRPPRGAQGSPRDFEAPQGPSKGPPQDLPCNPSPPLPPPPPFPKKETQKNFPRGPQNLPRDPQSGDHDFC